MQDYFVYLKDNPVEDRTRELVRTMGSFGLTTIKDTATTLKFRVRAEGIQALIINRTEFDTAIKSFDDIIREFPELPRRADEPN